MTHEHSAQQMAREAGTLREELKELAKGVFIDAATQVHYSWIDGTNGREPDFGEAASDYAESFADAYVEVITAALASPPSSDVPARKQEMLSKMVEDQIEREGPASSFMVRAGLLRDILVALSTNPSSDADALREALAWYGEQARLARLIHSEGDAGRHALAEDGGKRARAALQPSTGRG